MKDIDLKDLATVTPVEDKLQLMHEKFLRDLKEDPNNLSFWFPKVKDCGIRVPETVIVPVPDVTIGAFFMEKEGDKEMIETFVREKVMPAVRRIGGLPFIKNASYSDKFTFTNCAPADDSEETITACVKNIQYQSACWKDGYGMSEIAVRERIPSPEDLPRIYHGMPLNAEFRVFYDFDARKALYVVNYWDKDYCRKGIGHNQADLVAYDRRYPSLLDEYTRNAGKVLGLVEDAFKGVIGLSGKWSVDILLDQEGTFWLIDMALAHQSSYFDYGKTVVTGIDQERLEALFKPHEGKWNGQLRKLRSVLLKGYRTSLDDVYLYRLREDVIYVWLKELIQAGVRGEGDDDMNLWGEDRFIHQYVPKTEYNERLIARMDELSETAFGDNDLSKEQKEWAAKQWNPLTDYLFALALVEFLKKH